MDTSNGKKVVHIYKYRGLKGGAVIGFFVGLTLVLQTLELEVFDIKKVLSWTIVSSALFALIGWFIYGATSGLIGYSDSDSDGGGSDSGSGDCGGD